MLLLLLAVYAGGAAWVFEFLSTTAYSGSWPLITEDVEVG